MYTVQYVYHAHINPILSFLYSQKHTYFGFLRVMNYICSLYWNIIFFPKSHTEPLVPVCLADLVHFLKGTEIPQLYGIMYEWIFQWFLYYLDFLFAMCSNFSDIENQSFKILLNEFDFWLER